MDILEFQRIINISFGICNNFFYRKQKPTKKYNLKHELWEADAIIEWVNWTYFNSYDLKSVQTTFILCKSAILVNTQIRLLICNC